VSVLPTIDYKVDSLMSLMTLDEKIGQMNQYNGFWDITGPKQDKLSQEKITHLKQGLVGSMLNVTGVDEVTYVQKIAVEESRLGIPLIIGFDVIHGFKTISPIPLAESASWDLKAIQKSAAMAAEEAAAHGINWTFAPMVDIYRDARWGRVMEGAGEDPYLGGKIATARVKGFQGEDLSSHSTIAACAKHFAAYGFAEAGKEYNTVDIGTSTLHNIVFPPFKAAKDAGVKTFMNSFNEINGIPATASRFLQRDILKEAWGFDGFIVSDWDSIGELHEHGVAETDTDAASLAINAGSDMDMESACYINELNTLVENGAINETLIDDAVKRILKVKFELGLFEDPYKYCSIERQHIVTGQPKFHDAALDIAKKSIVLLKNEGILPLKKSGLKVGLIGQLAADKDSPLGGWRGKADYNSAVSVYEGLNKYTGNSLSYEKGVDVFPEVASFVKEVKVNPKDPAGIKKAVDFARNKDVVIMVLGEHGFQSGEGRSRTKLDFPGDQQTMLEAVYKVNKNIVLVVNSGRPLVLSWADENLPAVVQAWQLGTQSGNAIASILYGDYNPSGKLPMTFPRAVGQLPLYYNYKPTGRGVMEEAVFWSHYIDEDNTPLYPFGYGLSYTKFNYQDLDIKNNYKEDGEVIVTISVTNSGKLDGKEVVQLYLHDKYASITQPLRKLKGFELVQLKPGETKKVEFVLREHELGFYDNFGAFLVESGEFEVHLGGDSKHTIKKAFRI
jgi:beta-glucosidase